VTRENYWLEGFRLRGVSEKIWLYYFLSIHKIQHKYVGSHANFYSRLREVVRISILELAKQAFTCKN
jgi:hypothetical protein